MPFSFIPAMSSSPLITIVLPARNRATLLPRTLGSIAEQTLRPLRVILVDNGSTDTTRSLMEDWRRNVAGDIDVEVLEHMEPGACGARNAGLDRVTSPWVMFFDSDDEMLPRHCEDFARAIEANPQADMVGRSVKAVTLAGNVRLRKFETENALFNHIFHGILATQRYIVKTSFARKAGGWNPEARSWNDYEFGLRLLMLNPVMVKLPGEPSVIVYSQKRSITGTSFSRCPENWERSLDLCRDTLRRHGREDLMPWIEVRAAILAACYRREGDRDNSRRLLAATLSSSPQWRGRLRLLYLQNRLMHHGTGRIARYLFPHADGRMYPTRGGSALLTIVVHSRNGAACLPETLASIQRQTLRPLRVVLVDSDSTDATPELMRNWKQLTDGDLEVEIVSEKRHGDAARNAGLECVDTPYVMFLDSGEKIQPHYCAVIADAATGNPDADLFCGKRLSLSCYPERRRPFAVRTSLIRKIGGWNVKAWGWESYELEVRLWLSQPKTVAVGKKCAVIPSENAGLLKSTLFSNSPMKWEGTLDICEECMNRAGRDDVVIRANVQRMILAARYFREGARSEGRRLAEQTIARSRAGLRLRLLLFHHRIFGRGTLRLARILFPSASHV